MRSKRSTLRSLQRRDLRLERLEDRQLLDASAVLDDVILDWKIAGNDNGNLTIVREEAESNGAAPDVVLDAGLGKLTIVADDNDNVISAHVRGTRLIVKVDTTTIQVDEASVNEIEVHAKGGNDSIKIGDSVKNQTTKLYGGNGDDTIVGSLQDDTIAGGLGNDKLDGRGGNDRIWGDLMPIPVEAAADVEASVEDATCGSLTDNLSRRCGRDTLVGGEGDDRLYGGPGNDSLHGDSNVASIPIYAGNDYLNGGSGNDRMLGDSPNAGGSGGDDTLAGGSGTDYLYGHSGDDDLRGGSGRDYLYGGEGSDDLDGGVDNDYLNGGQGSDTMSGGQGRDTVWAMDGWIDKIYTDGCDRIHADKFDEICRLPVSPIDPIIIPCPVVEDLTATERITALESRGPTIRSRL